MIDSIAEFFNVLLRYIYLNIVPNYGMAIVLLTLLVKMITFPLNNKQIQSARRMQELQPEIKKIQAKFKNDKERQNKEVMAFMQQHKVNPLAGCLPLLVQLPILIGIFRLLSNAEQFGVLDIPNFNAFLIPGLTAWGNLLLPDPYYIFPILSGITTFIHQKLTMTDPNQKMLLYVMPVLLTFLSLQFQAGLVLYWTMNNLFSMGQHYLVSYIDKLKKARLEPEGNKGTK